MNPMKNLFKRALPSLMLAAGLLFPAAALTEEAAPPVPVGDRDAFEKRYIACVLSGLQDNCFITVFSGRFFSPPGEGATLIYDAIKAKMQGANVRKVHTLEKTVKAELVDIRTYLLELSGDAGFIGFYVVFRRKGDEWYVYEFALDRSEDFIRGLLNLPVPPADPTAR
ncbi:MAG: glycoside hydrolase family 97 C-terminal domain-containing protein [Azoarcus sp.]|nr:glycoside hydrolase family 97 C-terminal domain-containing protein [Azoarcus sp.]